MKNIEIILSEDGCIRFKENKIVSYLLEKSGEDMNNLALKGFTKEDEMVFAQLLGYSVSGYGDLSYASKESVKKADNKASKLFREAVK